MANIQKDEIQNRIARALAKDKIVLDGKLELSSLELVTAAVAVEREFSVHFELDEISAERFRSLSSLGDLVAKKLAR